MATLPAAAACRAAARIAGSRATARGFKTSTRCLAAQNFTMPALSPTMTEGNIASWKVAEGASFSAGDVLLEIETDKATMDVEAQDDGVMFKIMAADGAKGVQVGTRIAVVAEAGDDFASLEVPADEQPKAAASGEAPAKQDAKDDKAEKKQAAAPRQSDGETHEHKYPLLPSVGHLVRQHGLSESDVSKIKGTGPSGRLLKGDVLAYLGSIKADTPAANSSYFSKLAHLDLSNVKVAPPKAAPAPNVSAPEPEEPFFTDLEISVPVSMSKVIEVQKKIEASLGVFLPISTFITRATEVANDDLPRAAREPTASELFDQVLGLDKVKAAKGSHGVYAPQISAIPPTSVLSQAPPTKSADIIDILADTGKKPLIEPMIPAVPGLSTGNNVFSLVVPKAEEERAQVFLERCRMILEREPGRLVL